MGTKPHRRAPARAYSEDEEAVQESGVEIEEPATSPIASPEVPQDDSGFREFAIAGGRVSGEFRCADCGYGAVVQRALPPCPMCGGAVWESRAPRPVD
jgi:rubrerythrin